MSKSAIRSASGSAARAWPGLDPLPPGLIGDIQGKGEQGIGEKIFRRQAAVGDEGANLVGKGRIKPVESGSRRDIARVQPENEIAQPRRIAGRRRFGVDEQGRKERHFHANLRGRPSKPEV